ncbi:MAG: biopolymer transporter TolR, partial [Bacteroidota bacterium]
MGNLKGLLLVLMSMLPILSTGQFQNPETGFFSRFNDIGTPAIPGSVEYSESLQEYVLTGSGKNIWFAEDNFSFLWKNMEGDFIIQARMNFLGEGSDPHRKAGLMIRKGLSSNAAHVSCVLHGDGLTALQYREKAGADMDEIIFDASGPGVIQLEKKGNIFTMSVAHFGKLYEKHSLQMPLEDGLQVGLFICSHNDAVTEKAKFSNVRIFGTAPDDMVPYEEYLGSLLEVMDVETGQRQILAGAPGSWQAPNWTPDGQTLIFNADGLLYNFDLLTRKPEVLPTDFATRNNNDHVISFGGTQLAISHHAEEDNGRSVVYTLPLEGGTPKRVTPLSPSYLHGWSTDDKYLVYTGRRDGAYNIYRIPVEGGEEIQLTHFETLDDGPEYSPDGKYIYFNSARTGTMQVWRMDTDGGNQTQITYDEYQDWFPHVSPDNKWIVFISYPPEVPAADHPFYKRVYLRLMSVEDLKPRVIGYLYGGQGSINVPSWSPDSKK